MTVDEAKKTFDEIKAQGGDDDDILAVLYIMFQKDQIDVNQLEALVHVLGYELSDEFKAMSPEDQKTKGYEETGEKAEGVTKEDVEEAKEFKPENEDKEEPKPEEEDEKAKAKKLFGF